MKRQIRPGVVTNWIAVCIAIATLCFHTTAQSPYRLHTGVEVSYLASGTGSLLLANYLKAQTQLYTSEQLEALDYRDVSSIDRIAISFNSQSARQASDMFLKGSHVLPVLLLLPKKTRSDAGTIGILWAETIILNTGLTQLTKHTFNRPRPYVYNPETTTSEIQTVTARSAFLSGHTSATAANCFFAAKVFNDYFPDSDWTPVVWSLASAIPAVTGYLRVKGGKHYPTDVIAGYALGACIGYFVPELHKRSVTDTDGTGLHIDAGLSSLHVRWVF